MFCGGGGWGGGGNNPLLFSSLSCSRFRSPTGLCTSRMGRELHPSVTEGGARLCVRSQNGMMGVHSSSPTQTSGSYRQRDTTDGTRDRGENGPELGLR